MREYSGSYFDGRTSAGHEATLKVEGRQACVWIDGRLVISESLASIRVFPPVGNIPSRVRFHQGSSFESPSDLTPLDQSLPGRLTAFFTRLELNWKSTLAAVGGLIAVLILVFKVIVPMLAPQIAAKVPRFVLEVIEEKNLQLLEEVRVIGPTGTSEENLRQIEELFAEIQRELPDLCLRLKVVHSNEFGANAFALPAGQIVVTDGFLTAVSKPDQIRAVLYHEAGHVHFRHSMQALVKNSAVALAVSVFLGDVTGAGALVTMASTSYSRAQESEADRFAVDHLLARKMDPEALGRALVAIEQGEQPKQASGLFKYFSTHPPTSERVRAFRELKRARP